MQNNLSRDFIVFSTSKCFESCVESTKDKFLNPFEKECITKCLNNVRGFYIETRNGFESVGKSR